MNDVNPIKPFQFYCQPILPLVYDESLSYYETLCKVVGQLNTTGDAVNQLNEGLKQEISDRESADAALDARIKKIEETNKKLHFVAFENATPTSVMPTRTELWNWVREGDMICAVYHTDEPGRSQIYAMSCNYNAGDWAAEISSDFHFLIPLETTYDSTGKLAVKQKIVKLTIPSYTKKVLNVPWGEEIIEINTPHTSAEGMVNFTATVVGETVTASITPAEFIKLFDAASATAKLCVGVNARLNYNALELSSSVATVYDNSTAKREVRITFIPDPHAGRRDYVPSEIFDLVNIVGDKDTNTWKVETFGTELFDFQRYEGFQFTRKAGNVIEAADECDPATVAQYYNDLHGKKYQNLPVHLIDEVDNADYWNGTFDSYDDGHITFTFITSNYSTIGEKMDVRVIELSATKTYDAWIGNEKWSYAAKEFEVPYRPTVFEVDFWPTSAEVYDSDLKAYTVDLASSGTYESIFALIQAGQNVVARVYQEAEKTNLVGSSVSYNVNGDTSLGVINFQFIHAAGKFLGFDSVGEYVSLVKTSASTKMFAVVSSFVLPAPNSDGSDDGKVPTVDGMDWVLKTPSGGSSNAVLYVSQTLTDEQKQQARENVDAEIADFMFNATLNPTGLASLDKTFEQIKEAITAGKKPVAHVSGVGTTETYLQLAAYSVSFVRFVGMAMSDNMDSAITFELNVNSDNASYSVSFLPAADTYGFIPQVSMLSAPVNDMEIATKKYVDDAVSRAPITIKLGDNNAATSAATVDEIKAALEAGNAPVLESAAGDIFCFVLNWRPSSSSRFTIQYGTFDFNTDGKAAFDIYTVNVNAAGITYVINTFVSA